MSISEATESLGFCGTTSRHRAVSDTSVTTSSSEAPPARVRSCGRHRSSNNKTQTRQTYASEHGVELNFFVDWASSWKTIRQQLEGNRRGLKAGESMRIELGEQDFIQNMLLIGNPRGPQYRFELVRNGLRYRLTSYQVGTERQHNVQVFINGQTCLQTPLEDTYQEAVTVIKKLGGRVVKDVVGRVDIRLDLPGQSMAELQQAFTDRHYISRMKTRRTEESYTNHPSLYLGKAPLQLCMYDKVGELQDVKTHSTRQEALLLEQEWGVMPSQAVRVEFRLWRKSLRELGIDSVQSYMVKRSDLVRHLTHDVIRFTEGAFDPDNTKRAKVLPLWKAVQCGLLQWCERRNGICIKVAVENGMSGQPLFFRIFPFKISSSVFFPRLIQVGPVA